MFGYGLLSSAKTSQQKEIRREKDTERRDRQSNRQTETQRLTDTQRQTQTHRDSQTGRERGGRGGERYRQTDSKTEQSGQRDGVRAEREGKIMCVLPC